MGKKKVEALSDAAIRAAKPRDKEYPLFDGRGLYLLVRPNGERLWRLKFRIGGKGRLMSLGPYPDVSLKKAREKQAEARGLALDGLDPVQQRRELKAANERAALSTFEVVAEQWIIKRASRWTDGHIEQTRQSLRDYVFPKLGKRAVNTIDPQDITRVLQPIEDAGKLETLRRVRQRIGGVLSFAAQTGLIKTNPVREMGGAFVAPTRTHFASLTPSELTGFLEALGKYQGHASTMGIIWMILYSACRTGEIRAARVQEFDLDAGLWTVPAASMKKRRAHVVPLSVQAITMLRPSLEGRDGGERAFPSPMACDQAASENIVLQAIAKMGFKGKLTGHGLRACVSTSLEEMGYPVPIVRAQLSHAKADLTEAAYLRGIHLEPRQRMMQVWADALDEMKIGKPFRLPTNGDLNVIKMTKVA